MKSLSNKTEYDDELFYNTITSSLKTIFICPIEENYTILSKNCYHDIKGIIIETEKPVPVRAVADAKVQLVQTTDQGSLIILEHSQIITGYSFLQSVKAIENTPIKQGEIIGYTQKLNFAIHLDPSLLFKIITKRS